MNRVARIAALVGAALLVWLALNLILMLFAGILLAIFLRTLAGWLAQATGLSIGRALALVVLGLVGVAVMAGAVYAPSLAAQTDQLTQTLPKAASDLTSWLNQYAWGRWLLEQATSSAGADTNVASQATTAARRLMDFGVAVVVILFAGLYLAAEPTPYIRGVLYLVPQERRERAAETLYAAGHVLRWWLVGQAVAMVLVGTAMGLGLTLIGVQLAFLLGVLAGLFEFIPFVGPLLALGPALLLSLTSGLQQAAYVLALYAVVQTVEGYVLTPLVQRRVVDLPPVVTIAAQVGLSWAAGPIGLLVAVPLTAVALVTVEMLYVEDRLGDEVASEFESQGQKEVAAERTRTLRGLLPASPPAPSAASPPARQEAPPRPRLDDRSPGR